MATERQIEANRQNAENSTGPRTGDGKTRSSRNSTRYGLFTAGDYILPDEREEYEDLKDALITDLAPATTLEIVWTREILSAVWRLRRCSLVEAAGDESAQLSATRARAQAQNLLLRASAELRRLQTERQYRNESFPEGTDLSAFGLASFKEIVPALTREPRHLPLVPETKRSQIDLPEAPSTPRNAPCPCGSGQKFKRCCGRLAPAQLTQAA